MVKIARIPIITMTIIILAVLDTLGGRVERLVSAQSIIRQMAIRYSTASSYQDAGTVETKYLESGANNVETILFRTYFVRPRFFRFEWSTSGGHSARESSAVICDNNRTVVYSAPDRFDAKDDLSLGIAAATGVSLGAAHTIPSLLIENISDFRMIDLANLVLKGTDVFEGIDCFVITGKHPLGDTFQLWLGKKDYLLHKLRTEHRFESFSTVTVEVRREVKLNENIPLDFFHLN